MIITVLFASSKDDSLIAKPKLEELPLIFMRFFENSYTVDTPEDLKKKNVIFVRNLN